MDVALLGASGDCGREIASQLIASRLLARTERLQLVGRADGPSARVLHGLISDLTDAHAEYVPEMDVALSPREVVADLWVVACGRTLPLQNETVDRRSLAEGNAAVFAEYADALARYGQGTETVVVVSNPVELGVALFARAVGRERVIGIGAYQDTLRFRREIAADLGIRRQRVGGFMIGEHGDNQVPIWSSVALHGLDRTALDEAVTFLRRDTGAVEDFPERCRQVRASLEHLVKAGRIAEAFRQLDTLPPDVRVVVKPYLTHISGSKTVMATASVTVDLVGTLLDGREALVAGQVVLEGDFYGLSGPLGVPLIASPSGVQRVVEIPLTAHEESAVRNLAGDIQRKVNGWIESVTP